MTPACPYCTDKNHLRTPLVDIRTSSVKFGSFYRSSDRTLVQRFRCNTCRHTFSVATDSLCYLQKKRQLNYTVFSLLVSGVSQRRCSFLLRINRKTVVRKFLFMGSFCRDQLPILNKALHKNIHEIEFDDLETSEHSRYKPLSVTMAVEHKTRKILGFKVAQMSSKTTLSGKVLKKYGRRKDDRKKMRQKLFAEIKPMLSSYVTIKSDQNPHYEIDVKKAFPQAAHIQYKGRKPTRTGLGELKCGGFDPLFSLNHTFAMLRANINRLFRKTWCTTKKRERLELHIAMYAIYHNFVLLNHKES